MNIRWLLIEHPDSVKLKVLKPITKPIIKNYSELPEETKVQCQIIKKEIQKILPEAKIYLFGSRINGRWDENSDYDISILWLPTYKDRETIKAIDFGVKVDRWFSHSYSGKKIEIE